MVNTYKCCKDCMPPKRYPGCHGHCEEYLGEKKELDKIRERLARERKYNQDYYESSMAKVRYFQKKKKNARFAKKNHED